MALPYSIANGYLRIYDTIVPCATVLRVYTHRGRFSAKWSVRVETGHITPTVRLWAIGIPMWLGPLPCTTTFATESAASALKHATIIVSACPLADPLPHVP